MTTVIFTALGKWDNLTNHQDEYDWENVESHARIQKDVSEVVQLWFFFF